MKWSDIPGSLDYSIQAQGQNDTVLNPLMFLFYINDIADKISPQTRIKLFADDCLLYRTIDTKQDHKKLQQDVNTLVDWSHTWLMRFNAAKCHLLKITRKTKFLDTEYKIDNRAHPPTSTTPSVPRSRVDIRLNMETPHWTYNWESSEYSQPASKTPLWL